MSNRAGGRRDPRRSASQTGLTGRTRCRLLGALRRPAVSRAPSPTSNSGPAAGCRPAETRCRPGRRRGISAAELDGGRRDVLGVGIPRRHVVPIVHFYGRKELDYILGDRAAEGVHHRRRSSGGSKYSAGPVRGRADRRRVVGANNLRRPARRRTDGGHDRGRSREPGTDRVHLGHHQLPEGRRSTATRRSGSRHASSASPYPPDRGRQLTAAPVGHFIGMVERLPHPGARRSTRSTSPTCGTRRGAASDRRREG